MFFEMWVTFPMGLMRWFCDAFEEVFNPDIEDEGQVHNKEQDLSSFAIIAITYINQHLITPERF